MHYRKSASTCRRLGLSSVLNTGLVTLHASGRLDGGLEVPSATITTVRGKIRTWGLFLADRKGAGSHCLFHSCDCFAGYGADSGC